MNSIYDFKGIDNRGKEVSFDQFKGKVVLVVNTASKCGFTSQYKGLEELHNKYNSLGLVVIGFPCDQFGHQEPGSDKEIASFCEINYGVSFLLMKKIDVNGDNASPIFTYLKNKAPGIFGNNIKWNFTKFLISKDGKAVERFSSIKGPKSLESHILKMLNS